MNYIFKLLRNTCTFIKGKELSIQVKLEIKRVLFFIFFFMQKATSKHVNAGTRKRICSVYKCIILFSKAINSYFQISFGSDGTRNEELRITIISFKHSTVQFSCSVPCALCPVSCVLCLMPCPLHFQTFHERMYAFDVVIDWFNDFML